MDNFFYHPCTSGSGLNHIEDVGQVVQVRQVEDTILIHWKFTSSSSVNAAEGGGSERREEKAAKFPFGADIDRITLKEKGFTP